MSTEKRKLENVINDLIIRLEACTQSKTVAEERCEQLYKEVEELRQADQSELQEQYREAMATIDKLTSMERDLRDSVVALTLQNSSYVTQLRTAQQEFDKFVENDSTVTLSVQNQLEQQVKALEEKLLTLQTKRRSDFKLYQKKLAHALRNNPDYSCNVSGESNGPNILDDFLKDLDDMDGTFETSAFTVSTKKK
eukprot:CAMPEP_0182425360 /NCGR_PEP_ID=MMETSP1167-20130531/11771_1 /TAXON_ID=2988 /ORGANISM="Mallomonas Sp, Strain CCMP3275" /LENGTH=194 /DNA_ID=CAMNT_0024606001 /DNA_START=270 /DNA_END=854 /DNA_ORIENTATION=-